MSLASVWMATAWKFTLDVTVSERGGQKVIRSDTRTKSIKKKKQDNDVDANKSTKSADRRGLVW